MTQFFPNSPSFIEFAPFVEFGATLNWKDPLSLSCPDFFIIMSQKKTYAAASISDDAKTMIARLYQVLHAQGKLRREFVADMSQAGYRFSESQLDRWVARVNAGETAVSITKATSPSVHLTREQRILLVVGSYHRICVAFQFTVQTTGPSATNSSGSR